MTYTHIHIGGQVQGVGFRPLVYRLAQARGLRGWVSNGSDGVHIELAAGAETAQAFLETILAELPPLAQVTHHRQWPVPAGTGWPDFQIVESQPTAAVSLLLTPDVAICPDCRAELENPGDRRHGYPFITCTACGPRYSIIGGLPYDRPLTTMAPFAMCPDCQAEYDDPGDRRFFSQTNSCPHCAVPLYLSRPGSPPQGGDPEALIAEAVALLAAGAIVAVKGMGGYLLCCDATRPSAVQRLRERKHRPSKPFAVMYPSLELLAEDAQVSPAAREQLTGPVSPVLLLPLRRQPRHLACEAVAPGLHQVGAMLPNAPLLVRLMTRWGKPLVATSANVSGSPMLYADAAARTELAGLADAWLSHDRAILMPVDDSVLRLSPRQGQPIWLRRGRGLAPAALLPGFDAGPAPLLACGADLKGSLALWKAPYLYLSQFLGDQSSLLAQEASQATLAHLRQVLDLRPTAVLVDAHPDYASTRAGQALAQAEGLPLIPVPHHAAHLGALLAEHGLLTDPEPLLGIVWDGTGWGTDGAIWGGESLLWQGRRIRRIGHLGYFPHLAGDRMAREPRLCALALTWESGPPPALAGSFSPEAWGVYTQLLRRGRHGQTSSMGRLFDGVAALLGLATENHYEGEAALKLETLAWRYVGRHGLPDMEDLPGTGQAGELVPAALAGQVLGDLAAGRPAAEAAYRFHLALVTAVGRQARHLGLRRLGFSGGVFQNALLVDLLHDRLGATHQLFFHHRLPPNDENIALGQIACHAYGLLHPPSSAHPQSQDHVFSYSG